jgi:4-amino-4-deoxy-L-arabinose transferase-like glycosyltransferase
MAPAALASDTIVRHRAIPLALVLLLALLLRGGMFAAAWHNAADLHTLHTGDTPTYLTPAESLLADGTFSGGVVPEIYRTPGYPLLLTAGLRAGHVELVTVAVQTVLSLASILLLYHLAWKLTGSATAALATSALAALEPLSIVYTSYVMPETLFTFLLLASLSLLLHYLRTASALALFAAALLLAAATFVRPITYYLPPLFMLLLAMRAIIGRRPIGNSSIDRSATASADGAKAGPPGRAVGCLAAVGFGIVAFAPCALWQVRNYLETGYSGFTGIPECNLYFSQGASILARQSGKPLRQVQAELGQYDERLLALLHGPAQAATIRRLGAEGSRMVIEHPVQYAQIHLRSMVIWLLDPGGSDLLCLLGHHPIGGSGIRPLNSGIVEMFGRMRREAPELLFTTLTLATGLGLLYCAAALGLAQSWRHFNWQWLFVFALVAYFWLIGGTLGCARLRHPVMPLVCVLGGWGLTSLAAWFSRARQSARASTAAGQLCAVKGNAAVQQAA